MRRLERIQAEVQQQRAAYIDFLTQVVGSDTRVLGHGIEGGNERAGQELIIRKLREIGLEPDVFEPDNSRIAGLPEFNPGHNYRDRPNVVAAVEGGGSGRSIILNGHIDTMPFGDLALWETPPLAAVIRDGRLYGRGAADMKAGLVAGLLALETISRLDLPVQGSVIFESVVDEEGGGNGTLACIERGYRADAALITEPTLLTVQPAHMGFLFLDVTVEGRALHASEKWKGVNAIEKAWLLVEVLREQERQWTMDHHHALLPQPTINLGVISGGVAGSVVPERCAFKLCAHFQPGDADPDGLGRPVERRLRQLILDRAGADDWLREHLPTIEKYQEGSAYELDPAHPLVTTLAQTVHEARGMQPTVTGMTSGADARLFANVAHIPPVIFGPGSIEQAHSANEWVEIEQFIDAIGIIAEFILRWTSAPPLL